VADQPQAEEPHADEPMPEDGQKARRRRRVSTQPPPGTDPKPAAEPARHELTENDARLKADKPPHY